MDYVKLILILSVITFIAFYLKKKIQKRQFSQISQNSIIQIVDGIQVAAGQNMYLTKIGEEYVLVSMGTNGVNMIKLEQNEFVNPKEQFDEMFGDENPTMKLKTFAKSIKERLTKDE